MSKVHPNLSPLFHLFLLFQLFHSRGGIDGILFQFYLIPKKSCIPFTIPLFHLFLFQKLSKGIQSKMSESIELPWSRVYITGICSMDSSLLAADSNIILILTMVAEESFDRLVGFESPWWLVCGEIGSQLQVWTHMIICYLSFPWLFGGNW